MDTVFDFKQNISNNPIYTVKLLTHKTEEDKKSHRIL